METVSIYKQTGPTAVIVAVLVILVRFVYPVFVKCCVRMVLKSVMVFA